MQRIVRLSEHRGKKEPAPVYFQRQELTTLLNIYSQRVAKGEWRDYAIGHDPGMARFSVFRHTHEMPLFTVTKRIVSGKPLYAVFMGDRKLRQGARLADVLKIFDKPLRVV